jgi:hypothetical protein
VITEERVVNLEAAVARFVEQTSRIAAAIHEDVAEIRASNARTDRQLLELQIQAQKDREQADRDREQADKDREQIEKDRQQIEKDREQIEKNRQQADKDRKDFNRRMAEISDSMGRLIEDMVAPCGFRLAKDIFCTEEAGSCAIRVRRKHPAQPGRSIEYDLMAVGPTKLLIVEAKWTVAPGKAREFKEQMAQLPEFFPEYAQKILCPAVASVYLDPSMIAFLNREKIYGIAMGDETMEVVNLGQF